MYALLTVLIIIACVMLILVVLIQNPKGGGLNQSFGISNQIMGVKRTTDFLEKTTWGLAVALLGFSLITGFFVPKKTEGEKTKSAIEEQIENAPLPQNVPSMPQQQQNQPEQK